MSRVIGVRISERILAIAETMVELGMAKSRNEALNIILEKSAKEVVLEIQRAMNIEERVRKYEEEGGIDLGSVNLAEFIRRERDRWTT